MTYEQWQVLLHEFLKNHDFDGANYGLASRFLTGLHALMLKAPHQITTPYLLLTEPQLHAKMQEWLTRVSSKRTTVDIEKHLSAKEVAETVGGLVRACDKLLSENPRPAAETDDWVVGDWLLLPRWAGRVKGKTNEPYARRGIARHVIIPREIGGRLIELWPAYLVSPPSGPPSRLAAATFKEFALVQDENVKDGFIAAGVNSPEQSNVVASQLRRSAGDKYLAMVWPELTIPPELRDLIVVTLQTGGNSSKPYPDVVVAGSWHEFRNGKFVNASYVFDSYGDKIVDFTKSIPWSGAEGHEYIELGNKIPIIVSDDYLIALAICRDFCDLSGPSPYVELNVDYILVPSLGTNKAMQSHRNVAKRTRTERNARAFVVQQSHPHDPKCPAKVLPPVLDPTDDDLDLAVSEEFSSFDGHV